MDESLQARLLVGEGTSSSLSAEQARLLDYWALLAAEGDPPAWRRFDPLEVWRLVPCLVLYEVLEGGEDLRFRLAGGAFEERVGLSLRGKRLAALYPEERLAAARQSAKAMLSDPRPRLVAGRMTVVNREHHHYRRLSLPFAQEPGGPLAFILAHYSFER